MLRVVEALGPLEALVGLAALVATETRAEVLPQPLVMQIQDLVAEGPTVRPLEPEVMELL